MEARNTMKLTKAFSATLLLALTLCSLLGAMFTDAKADMYAKKVPVLFQRMTSGTDNPFGSLVPPQPYTTQLSNGNHNASNLGVAVGVEDTSTAIFIGDHWLKAASGVASVPAPGTALLADSSWFGSLMLTANSSTIDTVTYFLDHSVDGRVWSVRDSLQGHVISDRLALTLGAVSDSGRVALASFSAPTGAVGTAAGLSFTANPFFGPGGVTAQSIIGVNYVRVRIHMTPGDFAAAGASRGVSAEWVYPAATAGPTPPANAAQ